MNMRAASLTAAFLTFVPTIPCLAQFRTETNVVLVPVVVRDSSGHAVGDLRQEDFELLADGNPQIVSSFTVEDTSGRAAQDRSAQGARNTAAIMPEHFAAIVFDDAHLSNLDDIVYSRRAVDKYLATLQPADRAGLFTASGQSDVDFTTDRAKIQAAMAKLAPGPPVFFFGMTAEELARAIIGDCEKIVRRMSILPGARTLVFITPGFPIQAQTWDCTPEVMRMVDHAIRSRVVINSVDSRGLALEKATDRSWGFQLRVTEGTGGRFVRDTNDLEGAVQQLAATPEFIYVLGFQPRGQKSESGSHKLEVKLRNRHGFTVQARSGYWDGAVQEIAAHSRTAPPAAEAAPLRFDPAETNEVAKALDIPPAASGQNDEIATSGQPLTFRVQSNLVEVPVIVRDRNGRAVGSLRQQDFRILDKGKRQEIAKFSVVKAAEAAAPDRSGSLPPPSAGTAPSAMAPSAAPTPVPNRFVAFVFDDIHIRFEDLPQVRAAVVKYIRTSLGPVDRAALFTTSGRQGADFTARPESLAESLLKVSPSPVTAPDLSGCGASITYYQSVLVDQQVGLNPLASDVSKSLALRVAVEETGDFHTAVQELRDAYTSGLQESRAVLSTLSLVVQRLSAMPGQRAAVLVSPGFFVPADLQEQSANLTALAIRHKVLISTIGARGVWTNPAFSACQKGGQASVIQDETAMRDLDGQANTDELIALGEETGGAVSLDNDFEGGVRKAAAAPEYLYILGFTPQNLKLDGSFHSLKVTLASGDKLNLQARRGYWAPKHLQDELALSRQEIQDAVFSRDEIHSLPVEMHTQVTRTGEQSKLSVLTSVDLKSIHLHTVDDRQRNDLTIVAALFDTNGNFIAGTQKLLELRLRDATVNALAGRAPLVISTDFDVKAGAYLVRLVVRDAGERQITAENAAVQVQ